MHIVKFGDRGTLVGKIQEKLGINPTNYFGEITLTKVKAFQKSKKLKPDGEVGDKTFAALGIQNPEQYLSTDISNINAEVVKQNSNSTPEVFSNSLINVVMLDKDEFINKIDKKYWLFLHHTAGGHNPFAVSKMWNNDTRGRIATEYIIGGISSDGKDASQDGVIVKCMPTGTSAYHLGDNGNSKLHPQSVGIEICNYGWLTKGGYKKDNVWVAKDKDSFYNYVGGKMLAEQVCDLGFDFNGHRYYHAYTVKQIEALNKLIPLIKANHPELDLSKGLKEWLKTETPAIAFGYKKDAYLGKVLGLLTHTNIRKDKTDCSPQPILIEAILNW